ncbi:hypothetical protein [Photobacterium leiognathi]|uniref:hypothetical protein n=1 Tax=Photobacterium leiognathi TaxID=553611 RepID=UPI00298134FA|nr:hypothetical protein [Photobacterium leiognathi]
MTIKLKRQVLSNKSGYVPVIDGCDNGVEYIQPSISKSEFKAYTREASNAFQSGEYSLPQPQVISDTVLFILKLISPDDRFNKFCNAFDLYPDQGGRTQTSSFKGGALQIMRLLSNKKQISNDEMMFASLLGFKTQNGENYYRQLKLVETAFNNSINETTGEPEYIRHMRYKIAVYDSVRYFKNTEFEVDPEYQEQFKKMKNLFISLDTKNQDELAQELMKNKKIKKTNTKQLVKK